MSEWEWILNGEQIEKILSTEPRKIKELNILNDIHLSKEERIEHAKGIIEKWKNKYYCSICEKIHDDMIQSTKCCMEKLNESDKPK